MTTTPDRPADTRTMRIVHQAMRRDLARAVLGHTIPRTTASAVRSPRT